MWFVSPSGSREHCLSFKLIRIPDVGEEAGDGKGRVNPPKMASQSSAKTTAAASSSSSDATLSLSRSLPPKKRRYVQYADILDDEFNDHQKEGHLAVAARPSPKYMCRTCGKTFPTGQALGGHQTAHRPRPKSAAAQPAPTPDQESDQRRPPRILDFDLNELPPYS